ncbi:MCE family protein [Nocardia vaccinii]|uniref:MCE family protein n=1 Tax=Nocardia vaccinii TaxID=1822 RepID=UPI0008308164|nr:MCE family protein [Nocardia vaccinii]
MTYRKSLLVLAVFLVVTVFLTWSVFTTLERRINGPTNSYSALFTDVSGLNVGDDVRMAGVRVGRVASIKLDRTLAKVVFDVQSNQVLRADTTVSVTYQNLIGQRYLGLASDKKSGTTPLRPGAVIAVDHTEPSFDISRLLNGFEPLFSTLDRNAIDNISDALIKALQGNNGAITVLVADVAQLARSFAGPDEILGQVITNLDSVVGALANQSANLTTVIAQTRSIMTGLESNRKDLFDSMDRISDVVGKASTVLSGVEPELNGMLGRKPGFTQHFVDNKYKFEYFSFNLPLLLKGLARMAQSGSYVDAYVCDVRLSLVPGMAPLIPEIVDAATPGGNAEHSPRCR